MEQMSIEQARRKLGELVTRAAADGTSTVLTKNGIPAAMIVPLNAAGHRTDEDKEEARQ